ncbi:hypothetical protein CCYA_CCYA06G1708 [Cyanidiococcus yangmingshanensis]|nr:hypothetical protein CCYA_CCYA06G1708 [Cyanidiococcus yangmingshanensis]
MLTSPTATSKHPPVRLCSNGALVNERHSLSSAWLHASATEQRNKNGTASRRRKGAEAIDRVLERYAATVGVEVHVQLATATKAYCGCSTASASEPNIHICPVCTGQPGTLPVPNRKMVELAVKAGLALRCRIASRTKFDRKNYFYADTPKNFQISQYDMPIAEEGYLELPSTGKRISIRRAHMEEDSAKMFHTVGPADQEASVAAAGTASSDASYSLVDHNRAGVPLLEIVTGPDMESGAEAAAFGEELQRILRYAEISDCNMQDGSLRVDVNISIRPRVADEDGTHHGLGTKVELKNLNSFNAIERAVDHEILRQAALLDRGELVRQETRLWDEREQATKLLRVKEGASDYRYFPEPDIPLLVLEPAQIEAWRAALPELPAEKRRRYMDQLGLSAYDAGILTTDPATTAFFEQTINYLTEDVAKTSSVVDRAKAASNWIAGDIAAHVKQKANADSVADTTLTPKLLAELVVLIEDGTISGKIAKELIPALMETTCSSVRALVEAQGRTQIRDEATIIELIRQVMHENPQNVQAYRQGKTKLAGFFVGQVMKRGNGRLDPVLTQQLVSELLSREE